MAIVTEKVRNNLSSNLTFIRTQFGYNQGKIAGLLNVKRSTYAGWEEGRNEPSVSMLVQISNLYSVTLDQLIKS
jgi:transcriptional regulator with XRE-family HTH domain